MAIKPYYGNHIYQTWGWLTAIGILKDGLVRMDIGSGYLELAATASAVMFGVNHGEAQTSGATGATTTQITILHGSAVWIADSATTIAVTEIGLQTSIEDTQTIDNDDTGNTPLFHQIAYVGALADKKMLIMPNMRLITAFGV